MDMSHVISLGAGVQSSTVALLAARGLITPMPLGAIFADTQSEPKSVYTWLDWLEKQLPYPVYRVTKGSLEKSQTRIRHSKKSDKDYRESGIPAFTLGPRGGGILPRRCTRDYKIYPIFKKLRELVKVPRGCKEVKVIEWIGISRDEVYRIKESREPWVKNRWPLIELGWTRRDCLQWWDKEGLPRPPRSACVFCPYHSDKEWERLKREEPEEFARAVQFEKAIQAANTKDQTASYKPYLHSSRQPLDTVKFGDQTGQMTIFDQFNNECEGMCGV